MGTQSINRSDRFNKTRNFLNRFKKDQSGVTVIEFAVLALPFFYISFAILGYGLYLLNAVQLESAGETASRDIRTGQAQNRGDSAEKFKEDVCKASVFLDCDKIAVHVQSAANWAALNPVSCTEQDGDGSTLQSQGSPTKNDDGDDIDIASQAGTQDQIFMLTLCYEFELAQSFPWLFPNAPLSNGSSIVQAATAFKIEPY